MKKMVHKISYVIKLDRNIWHLEIAHKNLRQNNQAKDKRWKSSIGKDTANHSCPGNSGARSSEFRTYANVCFVEFCDIENYSLTSAMWKLQETINLYMRFAMWSFKMKIILKKFAPNESFAAIEGGNNWRREFAQRIHI